MRKRPKYYQSSIQVHHQPKEKSLSDYYFDYDPLYRTLRVRQGDAESQILEEYTYDQDGGSCSKSNKSTTKPIWDI